MNIIQRYEAEQVEKLLAARPVPPFVPGDTVRVAVKVVEGERSRTQAFEGVCIARSNKGLNSNFTVRKISYGEGVERVFALYSPTIAEIAVALPRPREPILRIDLTGVTSIDAAGQAADQHRLPRRPGAGPAGQR